MCPYPRLEHGRVRLRQRTRLVKFMCASGYELVGDRYATCRNGRWDVPMPVCVSNRCEPLPIGTNLVRIYSHRRSFSTTFCMPGYELLGSNVVYCNGNRWNGTAPECVESRREVQTSCDFESEDLCGWRNDELHDFDWLRINNATPSSVLRTGPKFDHTYGEGGSGHYMYIESTSQRVNNTARLLSPLFQSSLANNGCFSFYYHMYGAFMGGLRVYQKPDSVDLALALNNSSYLLFEEWGNLGDIWRRAVRPLSDVGEDFQIVIEGIRGSSFTSDLAIDDVAILSGENCTNTEPSISNNYNAESCENRCQEDWSLPAGFCSCKPFCYNDGNCCADFFDLCTFGNSTSDDDVYTSDAPLTQKLIGSTSGDTPTTYTYTQSIIATSSTTPPPTTTTTFTTTTTPRTTTTTPLTTTTTPRTTTTTPRTTTTTPRTTTTTPRTTTTTPLTTTTTPRTTTTTSRTTTTRLPTTTLTKPTHNLRTVTPKTRLITTKKIVTKMATPKMVTSEARNLAPEKTRLGGDSSSKANSSSGWLTALVVLSVCATLACVAYFVRRRRMPFYRSWNRGSDPEVHYLTANSDD